MSDTTMALQNTKPSQSAMVPNVNMRMVYTTAGAAIYRPVILTPVPQYVDSGSGGGWDRPSTAIDIGQHGTSISAGDSMSQKRGPGRPGKNDPDADKLLDVAPAPPGFRPLSKVSGEGGNDELPSVSSTPQLPPPKVRRPRGRPPGSRNKEKKAYMGPTALGLTAHVILVKPGEDVFSKILSFSQHGAREHCILSANGAVSNVTLHQAETSCGTVTFEGRFEILSLSGSFLISESGAQRCRTGGLSVTLASTDGHVLGGGVAGLLTAASPVQVVIGSFLSDRKSKPTNPSYLPFVAPKLVHVGSASSSPSSQGTLSESCDHGSPLNQITGNGTVGPMQA